MDGQLDTILAAYIHIAETKLAETFSMKQQTYQARAKATNI
jgi:hypothetical protein